MSAQAEAAPSEAARESIVSPEAASEATENTEGQIADQPAEGEGAEQPADKPEDKPDRKSESAKRRERRRADEQRLMSEAEEARKDAKRTRERLDRIKAAHAGEVQPKEADFADPIEYAAASALWKQRQSDARREASDLEQEATQHDTRAKEIEDQNRQERLAEFQAQIPEARGRYADFDAIIAIAQRAEIVAPHVADLVLEGDSAADVAYYLGSNQDIARQISRMPPLAAARELGRIEALLSRPQPKTQTNAPDPITPVKPGGTAVKDPAKMSATEYRAWREGGGRF